MAARLKFYVDWFNKTMIRGPSSQATVSPAAFFQGDTVPMQITILEPDPDGDLNSFIKPDISNMALKLAIGSAPTGTGGGPTPIITQFTWSKNTDESYFYADVAFNTAGVATLIGSAAYATAYMELEITELSSVTTIWQGSITIKAELIEAATVAVAPGETALSLEVAKQMFAPRLFEPGGTLTFPSADGTRRTILYTDNDGSWHEDQL